MKIPRKKGINELEKLRITRIETTKLKLKEIKTFMENRISQLRWDCLVIKGANIRNSKNE